MEEDWEVVEEVDLTKSNAFWNTGEQDGYQLFQASDNNKYKVWVGDPKESFQKKWWYTATNQNEVAETIAKVRKDLNKVLEYLEKNPDLWSQHPIAFGIYHAFDLHFGPFEYLEMRPNDWGGIGLNKPKKYIVIKGKIDNKTITYKLGKKRAILMTIRNQNTGELRNYKEILDLAIHELTHTVCNDIEWVPESKGGNHREPYPTYHRLMRKWAKECGILQ